MSQTCIFATSWEEGIETVAHHLEHAGCQMVRAQTAEALKEGIKNHPDATIVCDLVFDGMAVIDMPRETPQAKWIARIETLSSWSALSELCETYGFTDILPEHPTPVMIIETVQFPKDNTKNAPWHHIPLARHAHFMRLKAMHEHEKSGIRRTGISKFKTDLAQRMDAPNGADKAKPGMPYEGKARKGMPLHSTDICDLMTTPDKGWFSQHHFAPLWHRLTTQYKTGILTLKRCTETCMLSFRHGIVTQCTQQDILTPPHALNDDEITPKCLEFFSWYEAYYTWQETPKDTENKTINTMQAQDKILQNGILNRLPDVHILPIVQSALPYFLKLNDNSNVRDCLTDMPETEMVINTLLHGESMAKLLSVLSDNPLLHRIIYLFIATDALDLTA